MANKLHGYRIINPCEVCELKGADPQVLNLFGQFKIGIYLENEIAEMRGGEDILACVALKNSGDCTYTMPD